MKRTQKLLASALAALLLVAMMPVTTLAADTRVLIAGWQDFGSAFKDAAGDYLDAEGQSVWVVTPVTQIGGVGDVDFDVYYVGSGGSLDLTLNLVSGASIDSVVEQGAGVTHTSNTGGVITITVDIATLPRANNVAQLKVKVKDGGTTQEDYYIRLQAVAGVEVAVAANGTVNLSDGKARQQGPSDPDTADFTPAFTTNCDNIDASGTTLTRVVNLNGYNSAFSSQIRIAAKPSAGYRIKTFTVNSTDVKGALVELGSGSDVFSAYYLGADPTAELDQNFYSVVVEFEQIPSNPPPASDSGSDSSTSTAPVVTPTAPTPNYYRVLARTLNQRSGPGTGWAILGTLPLNTLVEIVDISADGNWALTKNGTWLSMGYLIRVNAVSSTGTFMVNVRAGSHLNVRSGPGTGYGIIGKLASGALVNVLSIDNGWALIEHQGGLAYVSAMYLF